MTSGYCLVDKQDVYSVKRKGRRRDEAAGAQPFLPSSPPHPTHSAALKSEAQACTPRQQHQRTHGQAHTHTPYNGTPMDKAMFTSLI